MELSNFVNPCLSVIVSEGMGECTAVLNLDLTYLNFGANEPKGQFLSLTGSKAKSPNLKEFDI